MPLTDPRRLRILKNLQTTLQGMTGAAYHFPVTYPSQVTLDPTLSVIAGNAGSDLLIVIEPTPDGQKTYYPAEQLTEEFTVNVAMRVSCDPANPIARAEAWEFAAADLEAVLTIDLERGGHACDTRLLAPQPFLAIGTNLVGVVQPVVMTIYRAYKDGT
jgi:hypothetical protein